MSPDSIHSVSEKIGQLWASVEGLRASVGDLRNAIQAIESERRIDARNASEKRDQIHVKIDELRDHIVDRLHDVEQSVAELTNEMDIVKPAIGDWKEVRAQVEGAGWMMGMFSRAVYVTIGAGFTVLVAAVTALIAYLRH